MLTNLYKGDKSHNGNKYSIDLIYDLYMWITM